MDSATTDSKRTSPSPSDSGSDSKLKAVAVAFGIALLGFVLAIPATLVVANAYVLLTGNEIDAVAGLGISMVSLQGIAFPATAWLYIRYSDRSWSFIPASFPSLRDLKYVAASYIGVFASVYAVAILLAVTSTETASNTAATTALEHPEIIPYLIVLQLLLIGPGEELLFRGVIQGSLRERFSAPAAILLASLTFAPLHITALVGGLQAVAVSIAILFVPSIFFGYLYEKTENIVAPAVAHGLYNGTLFALMFAAIEAGVEPELLVL
ncbi:CPBP family intramembrane glutamic endopeptidase [Halobacterium wangiae]|uniref:CPBP family intramembrane glutamic endopeptidase n=1 Tax=Halobacterium wangiae TaxID=2902623 RepID=UPI001E2D4508|nr:type II CAAX endopeptidase family protein [Halobacterium wangiae]